MSKNQGFTFVDIWFDSFTAVFYFIPPTTNAPLVYGS